MKRATYRGNMLDIDHLRMKNANVVAAGNANYNARGDLLGKGGTILKTREELDKEHINNRAKSDTDYNRFGEDQYMPPIAEKANWDMLNPASSGVKDTDAESEATPAPAPKTRNTLKK